MRHYKITILGFSILLAMLMTSMSYPLWGPKDYDEELFIYNKKGEIINRAPFPPSLEHPFGTDRNGQDLIYVNLYGMQFTILAAFMITGIRVLSGVAAGVLIAIWLPWLKVYFNYFFLGFRFVPLIIIALFLMAPVTNFYTGISVWTIVSYQIGVLTVIAFPSLVITTTELIEQLKKQSFIITSSLLGASRFQILVKHMWPYIKSYGLLMVVQQLLSTIVILMHLGIFNAFLGGQTESGIFIPEGKLPESLSNEWAGLIGQNFRTLLYYPWIVSSTLFGFFILIFLINQMKKELEGLISIERPFGIERKLNDEGFGLNISKENPPMNTAFFNFVSKKTSI